MVLALGEWRKQPKVYRLNMNHNGLITEKMSDSFVDLLFCWYNWLGKHSSDIWNLVPGCLLWTIWTEQNRRSFEDEGNTVVQLLELSQRTLFDWSHCWGFSDCSTLMDFLSSIRID